jgi:hypothetical protein
MYMYICHMYNITDITPFLLKNWTTQIKDFFY